MEPNTILAAAGAIGVFIIGYLLLDSGPNKAQKRIKSIEGRRSGKKGSSGLFSFMKVEDSSARRKQIEDSLGELEKNQKDKKKKLKTLKSKLMQADWKTTPQTFTIISVVIGLIVGAGMIVLHLKPAIALAAAFVIGFGLPRWFLNMIIGRRQAKFTANFSDAMDIIVRGVRTGLPLGDCLSIIAHESPEPIRGEFRRLVEGEQVGVPLGVCIEKMADRMPLAEVNFFGTVLSIQKSTGGNLGESLSNLSKVLRERKLLREKIKALSAEAKMSGIIIAALPPMVMGLVSVSSPEYMNELYSTPTGHRNLMISAGMMVFGIWVMRKMINFKF